MCCDILLIREPLINCELLCACALTEDNWATDCCMSDADSKHWAGSPSKFNAFEICTSFWWSNPVWKVSDYEDWNWDKISVDTFLQKTVFTFLFKLILFKGRRQTRNGHLVWSCCQWPMGGNYWQIIGELSVLFLQNHAELSSRIRY